METESLEQKVDRLMMEIAELRNRLDALSLAPSRGLPRPSSASAVDMDAGEEIVQWMGRSSFLPRVSAVCFLLVFALILRTITDNGLVGPQIGSILGMAYATLLIFLAWWQYRRSGVLAPIFAVCGPLLMYTVVAEAHARFEALSSVPAYVILVLTGAAMAAISYFHLSALPVIIGSLGMGIAAIGIDYPNPYYPHLAVVLLVANLLGSFATRLQRCSWLRWIILFVTVTTLLVWGIKLGIRLGRDDGSAIAFGLYWYLPVVVMFAAVFFATALFSLFRSGARGVTRFDLALPAVNALWALPAAMIVARALPGAMFLVGIAGILAAAVPMAAAWRLVNRRGTNAPGVTALVLAAVIGFCLSAPAATGSLVFALPLVSLASLWLVRLSGNWERGSIRGLSYLLQVGTGTALAAAVLDSPQAQTLPLQIMGGGLVGVLAFVHYLWCRRTSPPGDSRLFGQWDKEDRLAVFLLMTAIEGFFFLIRSGVWLVSLGSGNPEFVFQAGQSVIVNLAAAGLVLASYPGRNKEWRNLGILVVLVGAGRVFLGDLPRVAGVPLVASVLSFGVAVSLVSVALTRWQRPATAGKEDREGASGCGKCA